MACLLSATFDHCCSVNIVALRQIVVVIEAIVAWLLQNYEWNYLRFGTVLRQTG